MTVTARAIHLPVGTMPPWQILGAGRLSLCERGQVAKDGDVLKDGTMHVYVPQDIQGTRPLSL